jgi:predicted nucleotidyltransferase
MRDDYTKKYLGILKEIVLANLDLKTTTTFVFGSRAAGAKPRRDSDIDIGILAKFPLPLSTKLNILGLIEASIVPWHVDLVDFALVSGEFKTAALHNVEIWNQAEGINVN